MSFYLSIKLKQIKYSGDNIGRRFKIKLRIGRELVDIRCKIGRGQTRTFNKIVFQGVFKQSAILLPVTARIKELDPVYDDVGSGESSLRSRLKDGQISPHVFQVRVEGRGGDGGRSAVLTFILEISVGSAIRYVSDALPYGWLKIKFDNEEIRALPQLLKVELVKIEKGREYFNVLEGEFKGKKASVTLKQDGTSYLHLEGRHRGAARLIFNRTLGGLTVVGLGAYNAKVEHDPIPKGRYAVNIPDAPHQGGAGYLKYSRYAKTWFRIGRRGQRYLHVGSVSAGCVTVTDKEKWTEIYDFLIRSRENAVNVGEILVKD